MRDAETGQNQLCLKKDLTRKNIPDNSQIKIPNAPKIMGGEVPSGMVRNAPTKHQNTNDSRESSMFPANSLTTETIRVRNGFWSRGPSRYRCNRTAFR
jgi:hypothetical protein